MAKELNFSAFPAAHRLDRIAEASARGEVVNFGWIAPDKRTSAQSTAHAGFVAAMPRFGIRGRFSASERRYPLWKAAVKVRGKHIPFIYQQTGSCVGAGGANMLMTQMCVEALLDPSRQFHVPWWLYTYGRSRHLGGMRGRGEGSFGSAWAKAITTEGCFEHDPSGAPDLPDYQDSGGWLVQPARTEMEWSDGGSIKDVWLKIGRTRLIKTSAMLKSADDVAEAIMNGYACTVASMFGISPMVPRPTGNPPVRLARRSASWSHQMSILEYWDHPSLGEIFWIQNNWGPTAHGNPLADEPSGGFYVPKSEIDGICREGEVISFSGVDGYPARELKLDFSAF